MLFSFLSVIFLAQGWQLGSEQFKANVLVAFDPFEPSEFLNIKEKKMSIDEATGEYSTSKKEASDAKTDTGAIL